MKRLVWLIVLMLTVSGCANLAQQAAGRLASDLSDAMRNHTDPATVAEALPAYLLLMDALVAGHPDDAELLLDASAMYATFAGSLVQDADRAAVLARRAREYADRGFCLQWPPWCRLGPEESARMEAFLADMPAQHVQTLYVTASAWATWVQTHADDWNAIAEVPAMTAMFHQVQRLSPDHDGGRVHLYLGVLASLLPPAYGGKPDQAREHFERAMELSAGRDLMAPVLFARHYARLVFDRNLHDRLLRDVLQADPRQPGLTLGNLLAQRQARALLDSADEYF